MMNLPFQVDLPIVELGDAEIGQVKLPKLRDLCPSEEDFIQTETAKLPNLRYQATLLAKGVADKLAITVVAAYNAILASDTELLCNDLEPLLEFQEMSSQVATQRGRILALALLKFRAIDADTQDWTLETIRDPRKIHPRLLRAVTEFAFREENGQHEPTPVTEESLVKSSPRAAKARKRTGQNGSGSANATGQASPDSMP